MKTFYLMFFFALFSLLFSFGNMTVFADSETTSQKTLPLSLITVSPHGGSFAIGQTVTVTVPEGMKIFWTLHPKRAKESGKVSEKNTVTFTLSRSTDLGIYAFDTEGNETPLEIIPFSIESPFENEYFRFRAIDPNPKSNFVSTVTLENASDFSISLQGWKIVSQNDELLLPDEEMESGEIRRFVYPLSPHSGTVFLVSPSGIKKDFVFYKNINRKYFLERTPQQGKLDKRPVFINVPQIQ